MATSKLEIQRQNFLEGTHGLVEATDFERFCLWERHHEKLGWKGNGEGYFGCVGHFNERPVTISMFSYIVDGKKIVFFNSPSMVVNHDMVRKWLEENMPKSAFDDDGRLNITNANNFHSVL